MISGQRRIPGTCPYCGVMQPFPHEVTCPRARRVATEYVRLSASGESPEPSALPGPSLDVERLAQALRVSVYYGDEHPDQYRRTVASKIAREYARLSEKGTGAE
jgi:hypothetical protein